MRCSRFYIALLAPVLALLLASSAVAAPTDLDTTFSGDGKMIDSSLFSEQAIWSSAIQADGKIVTVGSDSGSQEWLIMRFNTDGTLDDTFDGPTGTGNGKVHLDPSTSYDSAVDVAIVPASQRIVVAGRVRNTTTGLSEFGAVRLDTDGDIDPGFNSGAVKSFEIDEDASGQEAYAEAVALDGGKIVIGGYAYDGVGNGEADFAIARLENDGDLDPTIDGDGTALRSMTAAAFDYMSDIDVDASGNIYTFGTSSEPGFPTRRVFVAARFDSAGSIDPTFNAAGSSPGKSYATLIQGYAGRVTQRATGEYALVGSTNLTPNDCLVVQFTETGPIDISFSLDGYQTVDFKNGTDSCTAIDEDNSGNLLIGGMSKDASFSGDAALARLTSVGDLDTTFDPDGKFVQKLTANNDSLNTVDALSDGKILLGGYQGSNGATAQAAALLRLNGGSGGFTVPTRPTALALDTTFDSDGLVRSDLSTDRNDAVNGLTVASDGSPVVVGTSEFLYQPSTDTYLPEGTIAKYLPNGSLDPAFGGDGIVKLDLPGSQIAEFFDATVLSDGSIVVVGKYNLAGANTDLMIAKYTSAGDLDLSFDTDVTDDGWVLLDFNYSDVPESIHPLADGSFLISGSTGISNDMSMFVTKVDANGVLDGTYGTAGITEVEFDEFGTEETLDSALLSDDSIVLAGFAVSSGVRSSAVAKLDSGGDPDNGFSADGEAEFDIGTGESQANGVAVQPDGKFVIAGKGFDGAPTEDAYAARINSDGSLDADIGPTLGFSSDGIAFVTFGSEDDAGNDVVVDPVDGIITLAGGVNYGLDDDFAFARFDSNGNLLATFDNDGFGSTPIGTGIDVAKELVIDSSRRVLAAGAVNDTGLSDFGLARLPGPNIPGNPPADGGAPPAVAPLIAGSSKISSPRHDKKYTAKKFKKIKGTATSVNLADPVSKVEIALRRVDSKRCYWLTNSKAKFRKSGMKSKKCPTLRWMKVTSKTSWYLKLRKTLPKDSYELYSRVTLASGTVESSFKTKTNKVRFKLR